LPAFPIRIASRARLERNFGTQAVLVPIDARHREPLAAAPVGDRAVSLVAHELTVYLGFVPALRVTHVRQREVVLVGPEERSALEARSLAQHVSRRDLPLALGHDPVLDADPFPGKRIGEAGDVTGRENARGARFQISFDRTAFDGRDRLFRKRDRRAPPMPATTRSASIRSRPGVTERSSIEAACAPK
jgi:hypothetical protein